MERRSSEVSSEAKGQVRLALAEIRRDHEQFMGMANKIPLSVVGALAFKTSSGRAAARLSISRMLPRRPVIELERTLVYRLLRAVENPLITIQTEPPTGLEAAALVIGRSRGHAVLMDTPWSFWAQHHALARLYERARPRFDMKAAVLEAHQVLLSASASVFSAVVEAKDWCVPTPSHAVCFLCSIRIARYEGNDNVAFISAETWITTDMMRPEQHAMAAALLYQEVGPRLGDGLLLPAPLRAAAPAVDGIARLPLNATRTSSARHGIQQRQALSRNM